MKTVRSLPPELQFLINEYNELLETSGYNQPYYDRTQLESMGDYNKLQSQGGIYQDTSLTEPELLEREKKIRTLYSQVVKLAEDLQRQGKIRFVDEADPLFNKEGDGSKTFAYMRSAKNPDGEFSFHLGHSPALPQFLPSDQIKPMRPIKAGQQEVPDRKLKESAPISIPELEKELMMRLNPRMRTGQEPSYYIMKDGNRRVMRPVEEEELQYYRSKNRI